MNNKLSVISVCGESDLPSVSDELDQAMRILRKIGEDTVANGLKIEVLNAAFGR